MTDEKKFLSEVNAVLVDQGLGKARANILTKQLENHGGTATKSLSESTTHILVGNKTRLTRVPILLKIESIPDRVPVLRADWLSACLAKRQVIPLDSYRVLPDPSPTTSPIKREKDLPSHTKANKDCSNTTVKAGCARSSTHGEGASSGNEETLMSPKPGMFAVAKRWKPESKVGGTMGCCDSDSDYIESEDEGDFGRGKGGIPTEREMIQSENGNEMTSPPNKKRKWICEISSTEAQSWVNHNKHITDKLEELLVVYKNDGEKWRAMSTAKVIQALKKHPKEITTLEEARALPFVGERLANKIYEIVSSGRLRRLENIDKEKEKVINMFRNIHGVGQVIAQTFYAQGYRTLQDLKDANILNRAQLIGIKHYHEFLERMQREEVAEIEAKVKEIAHSIDGGLEVVTCGSYRRGKPTCGDIDILITHPDGRSHRRILSLLLEKGHQGGFLTDDLSVHNDPDGSGKYLGVCKLEGDGRKHRRIDIMVVPYCEFPLALIHFTGSGHMNRSMRSKADKMGMHLSEHKLCTGVIRKNGVKIFEGTPLPVTCEEDVFRYLELEYREPKDRDWD